MGIFAQFNEAGFLRGLIHVEPGDPIPTGVSISEEQWKDLAVNQAYRRWDGSKIVPYVHEAIPAAVPDNVSLGDWRVGLLLWGRLNDVMERVSQMKRDGGALGAIADERLNYSNFVLRSELMQLRAAFGFSVAEVDESLWRAGRVEAGDLSGFWPV